MNARAVVTFDFDRVGEWGHKLSQHLNGLVPAEAGEQISCRKPEYIEDSADILFAEICTDRRSVVMAVSDWVKSQTVAAYHGSRLDEADIAAVRTKGLLALVAGDRAAHLEKKLARHPDWDVRRNRIESVLHELGTKNKAGKREGQTHLTLSRAGLVNGFNHYLTHGSEFDQHAAQFLLGDAGKDLVAQYGKPTLITLAVPGPEALAACNPFIELTREMPNLVREAIQVWAHWLAHPEFSAEDATYDCGLIFYGDVPSNWIVNIEEITVPEDR